MKAIIAAAGDGKRWANHMGCRKHQIVIDGETLLERIVRLLHLNGVTDITITQHEDHRFAVAGAQMWPMPERLTSNAKARLATRPLWSTTDRTLILLGDVYFTDEAIAIATRPYDGWVQFARLSVSKKTGKPGAEMFGVQFRPEDHDAYARVLSEVDGTDWPVYCAMAGKPPDTAVDDIRDWGFHVDIPDDGTDDFDFPVDYYRRMFHYRNGIQPLLDTCRRVKEADFYTEWLDQRRRELALTPVLHRKLWEISSIAQVYHERIGFAGQAIGFGVGRERMPAWLACHSVGVLATDRPEPGVWNERQHAKGQEELFCEGICDRGMMNGFVQFAPVDMRQIPESLFRDFDFSWSTGSFEHLGSIEAGLQFFCRQMRCLKPGGWSAHTTEFNVQSNGQTVESPDLSIFREQDFHELARRLEAQGDRLLPLDFSAGTGPADYLIDYPPFGYPHLTIQLGDCVFTSVLLIAQRGAA